jgi:lipopolysaccharide transport system ATP-binding protein
MGLTPKLIRQKEQEIIQFAELGEFISYPVKTYSAGMQVRLAFAISTSVGGDILLIDEVIGAGDARFMLRAQKRILDLVAQSEILILASHDLSALNTLCERGLVFHKGNLTFDGPIARAIHEYKKINGLPL